VRCAVADAINQLRRADIKLAVLVLFDGSFLYGLAPVQGRLNQKLGKGLVWQAPLLLRRRLAISVLSTRITV